MQNSASNLNQAATLVDALSNFVAQLDMHQAGGAMFVCCVALLLVGVIVVALAVQLHVELRPSRGETPRVRKRVPL